MPAKKLSKNFIMGGVASVQIRILKKGHHFPGGIISLWLCFRVQAIFFLEFFILPCGLICCLCVSPPFVSC